MKLPEHVYYIINPTYEYRGRPYSNAGHVTLKLKHVSPDCQILAIDFEDHFTYSIATYTQEEWTNRSK